VVLCRFELLQCNASNKWKLFSCEKREQCDARYCIWHTCPAIREMSETICVSIYLQRGLKVNWHSVFNKRKAVHTVIGSFERVGVGIPQRLKANSLIPCRSAKGLDCLSHSIYTVRPCLIHTCQAVLMPFPCHATKMSFWKRSFKVTAQSGMGTAWYVWISICRHVGDLPAFGEEQGRCKGTAWEQHGMCESGFNVPMQKEDTWSISWSH
jgi:hypothetical protein